MSGSPNRYLAEPRLFSLQSEMADIKPLPHGGFSIACRETIFRPAGGGQPVDYGSIELDGVMYKVVDASKANGKTYLVVPSLHKEPGDKAKITQHIDEDRRDKLSRLHTLQHIVSAELRREMPDAKTAGTGINDDATEAWIKLNCPLTMAACGFIEVDQKVRSNVLAEMPVNIMRSKSVEHAEWQHGSLFRIDKSVKLSGKVRVIEIVGIDANCCSGTHWMDSNVGPYSMALDASNAGSNSEVTVKVKLLESWAYWFGDRHFEAPQQPSEMLVDTLA